MEVSAPRTRIRWVVSPTWIASTVLIAISSPGVNVVRWGGSCRFSIADTSGVREVAGCWLAGRASSGGPLQARPPERSASPPVAGGLPRSPRVAVVHMAGAVVDFLLESPRECGHSGPDEIGAL